MFDVPDVISFPFTIAEILLRDSPVIFTALEIFTMLISIYLADCLYDDSTKSCLVSPARHSIDVAFVSIVDLSRIRVSRLESAEQMRV